MWDFYKLLSQAEHIIWHSLIFKSKKFLLFIYLFRGFLKKSTWIEWGADLYVWQRPGHSLKDKFLNHINRFIREHVKFVGLTFPADEEAFRKQFRSDAKCFFTPLPFAHNRLELLEKTRPHTKPSGPVRIQLAHNSLQFNNHMAIMEKLERFRGEDIKITMPLSYGAFGIDGRFGGMQYLQSVISCAKDIFGKKAVALLRPLELDNYLRYLWRLDVAVFDNERPVGLANILYMLYMDVKIYLPANTPHYDFFLEQGIDIYDTNAIPDMTYEEFISKPERREVPKWVMDRFTPGEDIKIWDKLFIAINGGAPPTIMESDDIV
ncbi:MAG: TDP-N-acetylfucosamine:lipid II N-acetylfucosaminyltransferase [Christensenellales bacterium]